MKKLLGLFICLGFLLSVQMAYSVPLQTDYKTGITNVVQPVQLVSVYVFNHKTIVDVAFYQVPALGVVKFILVSKLMPNLNENLDTSFTFKNKNQTTSNRYSSINLPRIRHVSMNSFCMKNSMRQNYRYNRFC